MLPRTVSLALSSSFALTLGASVASAAPAAESKPRGAEPAPVTDTNRLALTSTLYFEFDSAELTEPARQELARAARWLKRKPSANVVIEGHADHVGDLAYNKSLSEARARAVELKLERLGVDRDRITILPYGETAPALAEDGPERANRRVVLLASKAPKTGLHKPDGPPIVKTEYVPVERVVERVIAPAPRVVPPSFTVSAGGGVVQSLDSSTRKITDIGGAWNVRLTMGDRSLVATELAYLGIAQDIDDQMNMGSGASLVGNGVQGTMRITAPGMLIRPYAYAGAGYMRFSLVNADVSGSDNVAYVPAGLGLAYRHGRMLFDLRATVRAVLDDELFDTMTAGESELDSWSATAQIGWEL